MKTVNQPPVQGIVEVETRPINYRAVQLTWQNWGAVCELVPFDKFGGGVWVDPNDPKRYSEKPFPDIPSSEQHIGLKIKSVHGVVEVVNQGMWILYNKSQNLFMVAYNGDSFETAYRIMSTAI